MVSNILLFVCCTVGFIVEFGAITGVDGSPQNIFHNGLDVAGGKIKDESLSGKQFVKLGDTAILHDREDEDGEQGICWVQRVCHLEDTLDFYEKNFNFMVCRHQEIPGDCQLLNSLHEGVPYSITTIKEESNSHLQQFSIDLLCYHGVHRYQRGNEIRGAVFPASSYKGDIDILEMDSSGQRFLETPDGQWIILVSDEGVDATEAFLDNAESSIMTNGKGFIRMISLYVSDLISTILLYENVLGATIVRDPDLNSAICTWDKQDPSSRTDRPLCNRVGIELVQTSSDEIVDMRASQGSVTIATDQLNLRTIRERIAKFKSKASDLSVTQSDELCHQGADGVTIKDDDGHIYRFIARDSLQDQKQITSRKESSSVDWEYRQMLTRELMAKTPDTSSNNVLTIDASTYGAAVVRDADLLLNFHAPWCSFCVEHRPVYDDVAAQFQSHGENILFGAIDGSATALSTIKNDDLRHMLHWTKKQGYPALFLIPNSKKSTEGPVEYLGDWTAEDLTLWIKEHAT